MTSAYYVEVGEIKTAKFTKCGHGFKLKRFYCPFQEISSGKHDDTCLQKLWKTWRQSIEICSLTPHAKKRKSSRQILPAKVEWKTRLNFRFMRCILNEEILRVGEWIPWCVDSLSDFLVTRCDKMTWFAAKRRFKGNMFSPLLICILFNWAFVCICSTGCSFFCSLKWQRSRVQ